MLIYNQTMILYVSYHVDNLEIQAIMGEILKEVSYHVDNLETLFNILMIDLIC